LKSSPCWCGGPRWSVSRIDWEWKKKLINITKHGKKIKKEEEEGDLPIANANLIIYSWLSNVDTISRS
jgi:hypothetical protein